MISDAKIQQVSDALRELEAWVAKHRAIIHSEPGVVVNVSFMDIGAVVTLEPLEANDGE